MTLAINTTDAFATGNSKFRWVQQTKLSTNFKGINTYLLKRAIEIDARETEAKRILIPRYKGSFDGGPVGFRKLNRLPARQRGEFNFTKQPARKKECSKLV